MKTADIEELLKSHAAGNLSVADTVEKLRNLSYEDIGYARIDHARADRQGFP